MKTLNARKTTIKRKIAKKRKRGMSLRAKRAWEILLENPRISKEAAAQQAGFAPGQGSRVLNFENAPRQILEALGKKCKITDAEVAHNIALHLRANVLVQESAMVPKLNPAQRELFEKNWFDVTGNPKAGLPGVRPDLPTRERGVRLVLELAKAGQDPEYGKKMFEQGMEAAATQYVGLIEQLRPHLSADGVAVLEQQIKAMAGKN